MIMRDQLIRTMQLVNRFHQFFIKITKLLISYSISYLDKSKCVSYDVLIIQCFIILTFYYSYILLLLYLRKKWLT